MSQEWKSSESRERIFAVITSKKNLSEAWSNLLPQKISCENSCVTLLIVHFKHKILFLRSSALHDPVTVSKVSLRKLSSSTKIVCFRSSTGKYISIDVILLTAYLLHPSHIQSDIWLNCWLLESERKSATRNVSLFARMRNVTNKNERIR